VQTGVALRVHVARVAVFTVIAAVIAVTSDCDAAAADAILMVEARGARGAGLTIAGFRAATSDAASGAAVLIAFARRVLADAGYDIAQVDFARFAAVDGGQTPAIGVAAGIARGERIALAAHGFAGAGALAAVVFEAKIAATLVARRRDRGAPAGAVLLAAR